MNPIARMGDAAARAAHRVVPDPFVIAILLTAAVFVGGLFMPETSTSSLAGAFASGALSTPLLAFAFKMALILVTGHALADAPVIQRLLASLAAVPKTTSSAAALVALVAMSLGLLNWGLGLVGGAFLAREVGRAFARRGEKLHYPLIGAAGYMGLLVWHGGLSGSAPLKVAKESVLGPAIPIDQTVLSPFNLVVTALLLVVIPLLFFALGRGDAPANASTFPSDPPRDMSGSRGGVVGWLESGPLGVFVLSSLVVLALFRSLEASGSGAVNLDFVILAFLVLGLLAHQDPQSYARSFGAGATGSAGILLQFPIYFGILAIAKESGVLEFGARAMNELAADFGTVAASTTVPALTFISAAVINMVVPSGGGQWVLQAPLIADASETFHLSRPMMVLAFSYGDQVTNMLQPFWALPLLSITGLKARELLGYTILAMVAAVPIFFIALVVVGAG